MTNLDTSFDRLKEQLRIQKAKKKLQNTERKKRVLLLLKGSPAKNICRE
jgi:hypothetical protein